MLNVYSGVCIPSVWHSPHVNQIGLQTRITDAKTAANSIYLILSRPVSILILGFQNFQLDKINNSLQTNGFFSKPSNEDLKEVQ